MRPTCSIVMLTVLSVSCNSSAEDAKQSNALTPVATIALDGVEGRIDHFGLDAKGKRLFVAALGNDTVEVIDLVTGKVTQHIKDLRAPQGISFAPESNRLAIANDKDGSVRLYDGTTLQPVGTIDLKDDADNVRYDAEAHLFWVGYGDGGLASIDPATGKQVVDIKLDAHPESFQLEAKGKRVFVNVTKAGHVAVIDREKGIVTAKWPLIGASSNFPMALDEANHRLFIGCRSPAKLLVLDTETGKTVASIDIIGDTDDVFYDAASKQLYISGGGGHITVVSQRGADTYVHDGQIPTSSGARTSFFVPETRMLYVAAPHRGDQKAALHVFKAEIAK